MLDGVVGQGAGEHSVHKLAVGRRRGRLTLPTGHRPCRVHHRKTCVNAGAICNRDRPGLPAGHRPCLHVVAKRTAFQHARGGWLVLPGGADLEELSTVGFRVTEMGQHAGVQE